MRRGAILEFLSSVENIFVSESGMILFILFQLLVSMERASGALFVDRLPTRRDVKRGGRNPFP